jgi:hypothetical protein
MKGRPRTVGKSLHFLSIPSSSPPSQPCHPSPPSAIQAFLPGQPPRSLAATRAPPRSCLPCLLWHPFLLFILPTGAPLLQHPSASPTRYNRFLETRAPPWPATAARRGKGSGRAPLPLPGAPRVSGADRAGWAGPPGSRAGGARRRGRFPGVAAAGAVPGPGSPIRPGRARANF